MWWTKTATAQPANLPARSALAMALEPRMLFDGAVAATVAETADAQPTADASHDPASTQDTHSSTDTLAATPTGTTDNRQEVVFIDNQVKDYQQLISGLKPGTEVVVLDGSKDGLQQIADYLNGRSGIDAIHIISHGDVGKVQLGNDWLDSSDLASRSTTLNAIGQALDKDGDILLYGCQVGADGAGRDFITGLANATGADVAASNDLTGAASKGGDWVLEVNQGSVETAALDLASYGNVLAAFTDNLSDASAVNGVTSFTRTLGGVSYTFTFTSTGEGGDFVWEGANGAGGSASINMRSGSASGSMELVTIARTDGQDFTFSSIFIDNAGGEITNVRGYLDGVAVGTNQSMAQGASGVLSFGSLRVDQVQITSLDFFNTNFDDFTGDTAPPNATPVITNLNGDSVAWAGVGNTVTLDASGNASFSDAEFGALNSGNGNWLGATLTVQNSGTAVSTDIFGFNTAGANFTISGNALQSGGQTFATFTNTGGVLTISFTSSGTTATTALVNDVARHITYRSDTPAGDATIRFSMNDGTSTATANTTVTSDTIYITNTTDTATIDRSNGVSFSEAVAIAAADGTGSQTLIFTSAFSSSMSLAGNLAIAESLTINADSANGLIINGSTITLGGGTTLNFTNASGTVTIGSTLAGTGSLSKGGISGTLVLASASNETNMSGGITVTGGSLQVSNDDHLSSGTLTLNGGTLTNNSTTFTIDNAIVIGASGGTINVGGGGGATQLTLSGVISGSGTLVKNGQAILQLDGNNTYTGATNVTAGTLILNHANALGTTAGGTTVADGSSVRINGGLTVAEAFTVSGTGKTVSAVDYGALHLVSGSSTLSGNVTFTGDTNISAASGSTLTLSGALGGGAYNLNKTDVGTLILSNAGNEAGLTGGTTITAGTLSVANDDYLAAGTLTLNGGTLAITGATTIDNAITVASASTISATANATLSGALSGANALTKNGASTLTLAGTSSGHSGALNITAGGVTLSGGSALGDTSSVTLSSSTTLTVSSAEAIGSLAGAGSVVLNGALTIGGDNTSTTYTGVISGASGLTKVGSGTQTLTGANSFTGATSISAGGLTIGSGGALGNDSAVTVSSGATLTVATASLAVGSLAGAGTVSIGANTFTSGSNNSSTTFSGAISGSGTFGKAGSGVLTLSGTNSGSSAAILVNGGMLAVASDANLTSGTVTLQNSNLRVTGATTIDNNIVLSGGSGGIVADAAVTLSGVISGGSLLAKSGTGTLTLTGTNTYSGATSVTAGSLIVDGALSATSGVFVSSGATLGGSGSIFASSSTNTVTVQNGGTLSPGNGGAGALTVNGNLLMSSGSTLALDINGTSAGTQYDQVIVNGTVDVSGATLAVTHAYAAGTGDSYSIIVNDAADAVTGTFSGLSEGGVVTAGGNATPLTASYIAGTGNDFTLTAPIAPRVTDVSSSTTNGTYKIGDTITVTITFDTPVDVTGTPNLQLETGAIDRTLDYVSGSGTNTLTFSYTVQAGDSATDLDYTSTSALTLNGGTIKDGSSRDAVLTLPTPGAAGSLGANKALVVDGVRPVASSIVLDDTALKAGETATVTITFAEAVTGLDAGDLTVAGGTIGALSSADGGFTWTTTFTPTSNLTSGTNVITLNNAGVTDQAGNAGDGSTSSLNYTIDTQLPTATIDVADTALKAGQTTIVTITFSEAVSGLTTGDFTVANGSLSALVSTDGGITWTATLTPDANVTDPSNLISLNNAGVQDGAGNAGTGSTDSNNYAIDTERPTATILVADTALKAGQGTTVTITFSEAVSGLTTGDFTVANGSLSGLSSIDGGLTWTATLTPDANITDPTNLISLDNTGVQDAAGNTGTGSTDSNNYAIDSLAPAVTSVTVPANGTYGPGQNLDFTVNFGEAVTVDTLGGTPRLVITLDTGGTAYAQYLSGSGTTALVFRLVVTSGQADANGISVGGAIQANGGTLRDAAGNDAVTTLNSVGDTSAVLVDAVAPRVTDIVLDGTSPTTNSSVSFTVTFSEDVTGLDLADFNLLTGGSVSGTLQSLVQLTGNTWRVTVSGITGQGSLGLSLPAIASGVADGQGNAMVDSYSTIGYQIGSLDNGDPEFRANPPVTTPTETPVPLQPTVPSAPPPSTTTSPLIPPPLFEQPTLGSGIPTVGNIFINNGALAPSFIAQVFASSDSSGDGSGAGFLGFGGGDGGVFGASTFSGLFSKDKPQESNEKIFDKQRGNGQGGRSFGAPTLGQQLHEMKEAEQRQVRQLAQALGQVAGTAAQG